MYEILYYKMAHIPHVEALENFWTIYITYSGEKNGHFTCADACTYVQYVRMYLCMYVGK
jgi:hypothetical protein